MTHKYLHLEHDNGVHIGPLKTLAFIIIFSALIIVPTYIISDHYAYQRGIKNGLERVKHAMHQAVVEGMPIAFVNNDVRLVYTIKTDSKEFRGNVKEMADRYELIKYRITEEFGPEEKPLVEF